MNFKLANIVFYYDTEDDIWYDEKFNYRFYRHNTIYKLYYGGFDNLIYESCKIEELSIDILSHIRKLKLNKINSI